MNSVLNGIANHPLPLAVGAPPQASPLPPSLPASSVPRLIAFFVDALRTGQARCAIGRLPELLDHFQQRLGHFHSDGEQLPGSCLEEPRNWLVLQGCFANAKSPASRTLPGRSGKLWLSSHVWSAEGPLSALPRRSIEIRRRSGIWLLSSHSGGVDRTSPSRRERSLR